MKKDKGTKPKTTSRPTAAHPKAPWYNNPTLLLLSLLFITFAVYISSALHNQFTNWDDPVYVTENALIRSWDLPKILAAQTGGNWAPIHLLTLSIEYSLFDLNPTGYHIVSLLLHLCFVAAVFFASLKLCRNQIWAAGIALVSGIHPMHVESVAWVSAQKDLLYATFYLAAIYTYIRYKEAEAQPKLRPRYYALTTLFFILSCLSKAMAVTLPIVLVLVDSLLASDWNWKFIARNLVRKIPFLIISVAIGVEAVIAQKGFGALDNEIMLHYSLPERLMFASYALVIYLVKFFAPYHLSAIYSYPMKDAAGHYPIIFYTSPVIVILLAGIFTAFIIRQMKHKKDYGLVLFGLLFFLLNVALVLQLKTVGYSILAERYTYLSYVGLLLASASAIDTLAVKFNLSKNILIAIMASLILFFSVDSYIYAGTWRDSISLWTHLAEEYKPAVPVRQVANAYQNRAMEEYKAGNMDAAFADWAKAISLNPAYTEAYNNRGNVYAATKRYDLALSDYNKVLELDPKLPKVYHNRGMVYYLMGDTARAMSDLAKEKELTTGQK